MISPIERLKEFPTVLDFYTEGWFKDQLSKPVGCRHPLANFLEQEWPSEKVTEDTNGPKIGSLIRKAEIKSYERSINENRGYFIALEKILKIFRDEIDQSNRMSGNLKSQGGFIGEFFKLFVGFQLNAYGHIKLEPRISTPDEEQPDIAVTLANREIFCEVYVPQLSDRDFAGGFGKNRAIPKISDKWKKQIINFANATQNPIILFVSANTSLVDVFDIQDAIAQDSPWSILDEKRLTFRHPEMRTGLSGVIPYIINADFDRGLYLTGKFIAISEELSRKLDKEQLELLNKAFS